MIKKMLMNVVVVSCVLLLMGFCGKMSEYKVEGKIIKKDGLNVTIETEDGNLWKWEGYYAENIGDKVVLTLCDNETINIYDDFIVDIEPAEE